MLKDTIIDAKKYIAKKELTENENKIKEKIISDQVKQKNKTTDKDKKLNKKK